MTASAYAPAFPSAPIQSYRRRPAYRGPLIVIPGGRARRRAEMAERPQGRVRPAPLGRVSGEAAAAATQAFQARLRDLPVRSEISLRRSDQSAKVDGAARALTPREFHLLAALAAQPGEPVTRSQLLEVGPTRGELDESSRAVDVHIAHLRGKLGLPGVIATVRGRGYALNPVYRVSFADAD